MRFRLLALLLGTIVLTASCTDGGNGQDQPASPNTQSTARATPTGGAADGSNEGSDEAQRENWATCEHPEGIAVSYPDDWHTNEPGTLPACSAFDPQPLDASSDEEFIDSAVLMSVQPVDFSTAADPAALPGEVLEESETAVDGHDAVRVETQAADSGQGERTTRWLVVLDRDRTLSLVSHEVGNPGDYESNREVMDEMVSLLQLPDNL